MIVLKLLYLFLIIYILVIMKMKMLFTINKFHFFLYIFLVLGETTHTIKRCIFMKCGRIVCCTISVLKFCKNMNIYMNLYESQLYLLARVNKQINKQQKYDGLSFLDICTYCFCYRPNDPSVCPSVCSYIRAFVIDVFF